MNTAIAIGLVVIALGIVYAVVFKPFKTKTPVTTPTLPGAKGSGGNVKPN